MKWKRARGMNMKMSGGQKSSNKLSNVSNTANGSGYYDANMNGDDHFDEDDDDEDEDDCLDDDEEDEYDDENDLEQDGHPSNGYMLNEKEQKKLKISG